VARNARHSDPDICTGFIPDTFRHQLRRFTTDRPCCVITSSGTDRNSVFALLLYVTRPATKYSDAPLMFVILLDMSPPVQDSAAAIVKPFFSATCL
jgi:hypothetical protein